MNNNQNITNANQMDINNVNLIPNGNGQYFNNNANNPVPMNQNVMPTSNLNMNTPENNNPGIVLGTTSNVTYNDTIGNVFDNNQNNNNPINTNQVNTNQVNTNQINNNPVPSPQVMDDNRAIAPSMMQENNSDANAYINDMNVNGTYNNMEAPSYVNEAQVTENVKIATGQKKVTVPVSKELKTVIIISVILLLFIFVMPILGDLLNNIRFR